LETDYGDELEAKVSDPLEQSVQRGLVRNWTLDAGYAVGFLADVQAVEPGGPMGIEMAHDPYLVEARHVVMVNRGR
jgi:hypothetical protein